MTFKTSVLWLQFSSLFVAFTGLLFFLATFTPVELAAELFIDIAVWPVDSAQSLVPTETRLLMAISGGLLVGWGLMMWQLTRTVYTADPVLGRSILLTGILSWFVFDSLGSIAAGAPFNAILNMSFLLMFIIPLWKPISKDAAMPA